MIKAVRVLILIVLAQGASRSWSEAHSPRTNSTIRMPSEWASGAQYRLADAFPGLTFEKPVAVRHPAGDTNRLFVVERAGQIVVLTNLMSPTRTVFLDISTRVYSDWEMGHVEGLSSLAFHPDYLSSRFPVFYVTYTLEFDGPSGRGNYNRLARFQSSRAQPDWASPDSEVPLITQRDQGDGHNFNDLAFGADGYLYVAVGDEGDGGTGDDFNNAQQIDQDFFSGILRLDVDHRMASLPPNAHPAASSNYAVPPDNPWVGATSFNGRPVDPDKVRTEFYAVGLRNTWRMAFDPLTGLLYAGDVGQHGREEINLIVKGGNYGWSFLEGTLKGPKGLPASDISLINPIHEYSPSYGADGGFSVTGGIVYRGQKLPELIGAYIFADYVTGNVWALRHDGTRVTWLERLVGRTGIAGFGTDPRNGELLIVDHDRGHIFTLEHALPPAEQGLPPTLSATGAFSDLTSLTPQSGVLPYEVNAPFWSDGARKLRWFSLPDPSARMEFHRDGNWTFPSGTVWIKHFELTNAVSQPVRRLETRLLVKTSSGVYGVTYRWGDSTTEATLVSDEGMDEVIMVEDHTGIRPQTWHYPSRSECLACHTPSAGYALGFNTAQLNRDGPVASRATNQIAALSALGCLTDPPDSIHTLPVLAPLSDASVSREFRVRSFLAAECASCHQPGTSVRATWDARISTPLTRAGIVDGLVSANRGDPGYRIIQPGSVEKSMLLSRISELGKDHMPPIGSSVLNTDAIDLVRDWVLLDLPQQQSYRDWQSEFFDAPDAASALPESDADSDGAVNYLEFLTGRDPWKSGDVWTIDIRRAGGLVEVLFPKKANRIYEVQWSDNVLEPAAWRPVEVLENRPLPSAADGVGLVQDPWSGGTARYYRVTVREP